MAFPTPENLRHGSCPMADKPAPMSPDTIRFECPTCGEVATVDVPMRELLLVEGCVVCRAVVTGEDFRPV